MSFGNLKTDAGVKALNDFLSDKSYIEGYTPSQADVVILETLAKAPGSNFCHALRWYNHISSYSKDEKAKFSASKQDASTYCTAGAGQKEEDDDFDLFASDGEDEVDEEAERVKAERVKQYEDKKAQKKAVVPKSSLILDVKPWDDETDMGEVEKLVRSIEADGLLWGAAKLVPVGYGIKKLQIACVIEDDKISTDFLEEEIVKFEDHVQSMDIAAFNKV